MTLAKRLPRVVIPLVIVILTLLSWEREEETLHGSPVSKEERGDAGDQHGKEVVEWRFSTRAGNWNLPTLQNSTQTLWADK